MSTRPALSEPDLDRLAGLAPTCQQATDRLVAGFAALAAALPAAQDVEQFVAALTSTPPPTS